MGGRGKWALESTGLTGGSVLPEKEPWPKLRVRRKKKLKSSGPAERRGHAEGVKKGKGKMAKKSPSITDDDEKSAPKRGRETGGVPSGKIGTEIGGTSLAENGVALEPR